MGFVMRHLRSISVDRGSIDKNTIKKVLSVLKNEHSIGIFPEGTRSKDGELKEGKQGAAIFSLLSGAPIVPAAILGTVGSDEEIKSGIKKKRNVIIGFSEPIYPDKFDGNKKEKTEKIMNALYDSIQTLKKELENIWEQ
jgi:1-acyl-sn-glycerol-3-phosphate acyltransferase